MEKFSIKIWTFSKNNVILINNDKNKLLKLWIGSIISHGMQIVDLIHDLPTSPINVDTWVLFFFFFFSFFSSSWLPLCPFLFLLLLLHLLLLLLFFFFFFFYTNSLDSDASNSGERERERGWERAIEIRSIVSEERSRRARAREIRLIVSETRARLRARERAREIRLIVSEERKRDKSETENEREWEK